jgi:hypothetical protein
MSSASFHLTAAAVLVPLLSSCALARTHLEADTPRRLPAEVVAWCGVHPDDQPAADRKAATMAAHGITATFGPCLPPDWSTYTPATPGQRYADPATYRRLVAVNAAAGLRTYVYDARLWADDPTVRASALTEWAPYTPWIAGWDMSDEWDADQWPELERRWNLVWSEATAATGIEPITNNLPWMAERAIALPGDVVSFDDYDVDRSVQLARRLDGRAGHLMCAVNALTHGPFVATPDGLRDAVGRHMAAGCDSVLVFGGDRPINTPGFDDDSLVTRNGAPTPMAVALAEVVG